GVAVEDVLHGQPVAARPGARPRRLQVAEQGFAKALGATVARITALHGRSLVFSSRNRHLGAQTERWGADGQCICLITASLRRRARKEATAKSHQSAYGLTFFSTANNPSASARKRRSSSACGKRCLMSCGNLP